MGKIKERLIKYFEDNFETFSEKKMNPSGSTYIVNKARPKPKIEPLGSLFSKHPGIKKKKK